MYSVKRKKGNVAENIVVLYLKNTGFHIIEQNYLKKWGEIDIIAQKLNKIYFIEVKSSILRGFNDFMDNEDFSAWKINTSSFIGTVSRETDNDAFEPIWNMTKKKKSRFSKIIRTYLAEKYDETMPDFQIDVFSIVLDFYKKIAYISRIDNVLLEDF